MAAKEGTKLWAPNEAFKSQTVMAKYQVWLAEHKGLTFHNYEEMWQWSVDNLEIFWRTIWEFFNIQSATPFEKVLERKEGMIGSKWFTGATFNLAEQLLSAGAGDKIAIHAQSEIRPLTSITWDELKKQVITVATQLRKLNVKQGDRVVAYMPTIPETVVAMLATISIGATWSSCSPDFGTQSVLDRFKQIEPTVLFTVDGYPYGGKIYNRCKEVQTIAESLPTLKEVIYVPYVNKVDEGLGIDNIREWSDLFHEPVDIESFVFDIVPFDHPLSIMYSSGTTGIPKAMVHSHGGIMLEMLKLSIHSNFNPNSCVFFYTTTGWMMFNLLSYTLLTGSAIVLYDGNPAYPNLGILWEIAQNTKTTTIGASPLYINLMKKHGLVPSEQYDLTHLNCIILSGAPAGPDVFEWVYKNVKSDIWLTSQSGGTDICSGFVVGVPIKPVYAGEIQGRALGVDVHSFDEDGKALINEMGELVVLQPMPSMPIYFWNDEQNERYQDSYFDMYPNIWRHGDYLKVTDRGTCIIYGRSDSTLNRNGIRVGTSEIYSTVESFDEVQDSLIVEVNVDQNKSILPLFIVLKESVELTDELKEKLNNTIRQACSPRHVPDEILQITQVPYTLTGKKMEVPVRKILMGVPIEKAANRDAMTNPSTLDYFVLLSKQLITQPQR